MQRQNDKNGKELSESGRLTVTLKAEELTLLKRLADKEGETMAHVVRRAVRKYLKEVQPAPLFDEPHGSPSH